MSLPPRQEGPAAWVASELGTEWMVELGPQDIAELEAAARPLDVERLARLEPADFPLPTLGRRLHAFRDELLHGRGFLLLRGLPVERYTRETVAAMFLGVSVHLGRLRSQNAKGHLLGHVFDLGLSSDDPAVRIYQTHKRQTFHTDSCDVVGLLCLRKAKRGGDSMLVSALSIFNVMRASHPDLLARLLEPMPHDRRGEVPAGMKPTFDISVYSWLADELTVFYQRQYFDSAQRFPDVRRLTEDDVAALDRFDAIANDDGLHLRMSLEPGDMQFVHNHNLLHDRTEFEDWPDPERKRHLLRSWVAVPGARELPRSFEPRYGSIEVGNRGGVSVPGMSLNVPPDPV
jgi:hypothetical protein